jgi:hypothetical protein
VLSDLVREMKKIPVLGLKIERDWFPTIYSLACKDACLLIFGVNIQGAFGRGGNALGENGRRGVGPPQIWTLEGGSRGRWAPNQWTVNRKA